MRERRAGQVLRYHTWPTITRQTVSDHTHNVMRIYDQVVSCDVPWTTSIMRYMIWHDMGEVAVGDLPYPVKKDNPLVAKAVRNLEAEELQRMGVYLPELSVEQHQAVKIAEYLEMAEFAHYEMKLGNSLAAPILSRMRVVLQDNIFTIFWGTHTECARRVDKFMKNLHV